MIEIEKIGDEEHYQYKFPTIDFKFQNTGNATAFLWKFGIDVFDAVLDPTPKLDFKFDVIGNALKISCINNGWGVARQCLFTLDELILNQIFTEADRHYYTDDIPSGDEIEAFFLTPKQITTPFSFEELRQKIKEERQKIEDEQRSTLEDPFESDDSWNVFLWPHRRWDDIELEKPEIKWSCYDEKGRITEGYAQARQIGKGEFVLTKQGFAMRNYYADGGCTVKSYPTGRSTTYIAIIDPARGSHARTYPISRKIPPGDIERFHIMIGAPISCHFSIQFKFFVDKGQVIESEQFAIEIWNPKDSGWHDDYKDGDELPENYRKQIKDYPFKRSY